MSAHRFSLAPLHGGRMIRLSDFQGRPILVVNTASKCPFGHQMESMQLLHETFEEDGLVVIGVPSGNFGDLEYMFDEDIAAHASRKYGVTFRMAARSHVVGPNACALFKWIADEAGVMAAPQWNFHKYLIDRSGKLIGHWPTPVMPEDNKITRLLYGELAQVADAA